jgi:outer membrane protein OmpA-like peptidoglycan-associated protein
MSARHLLLFALLASTCLAHAQRSADAYIREGDRHFARMAYARAVEAYTVAAEAGARNEHVTKRLAESHMKLRQPDQAAKWYSDLMKFLNVEPRDMYMFAEALKGSGRYEEAEEWMDRYLEKVSPGAGRRSNINSFARRFNQDLDRFTVRPVSINSPRSDMCPAWLGPDRLVFASARAERLSVERVAAWNGEPFLDLFVADLSGSGELANARPLEGEARTAGHDGPATATADGSEIWFTRSGPPFASSPGARPVARLGIHVGRVRGDEVADVRAFPFNEPSITLAHPAISRDGGRMVFASDMPGGYGGMDLYECLRTTDGWSEPRNLGPGINTPRNEVFPFLAADGTLYFASNGHPGLGGLDILAAAPADKGFAAPINLGAPVNSPRDDFGLVIDAHGRRGFFTSDRPGGVGGDDIYAFEKHGALAPVYLVTGVVYDDEIGSSVIGAEVQLQDLRGTVLATTTTGARGEYTFPVEKDRSYRVVARLKGRYDGEAHLGTERIDEEQIIARDIHLVADVGVWMRAAVRKKDEPGFLEGVKVTVVNMSTFQSTSRTTGPGGDVALRLELNEDFEVLFEKEGWYSLSVPVSSKGMRQGIVDVGATRDLAMERLTLGEPKVFKHVVWDKQSVVLGPLAKLELDELVERMRVNPDIEVELAVHGDTRSDADLELVLSRKRAEAMAQYLISKGIIKERVRHRGYGNSQPLNHCVPGVECTPAEHAVNKRSTWMVTGLR